MKLFAKCIEAISRAGFIHAQHRTDGVDRRAGHVRRNGGHVAGITGHVRPEYARRETNTLVWRCSLDIASSVPERHTTHWHV